MTTGGFAFAFYRDCEALKIYIKCALLRHKTSPRVHNVLRTASGVD